MEIIGFWLAFKLCVIVVFYAVTYPLDITKTRLQVQGEHASRNTLGKTKYRGMIKTAAGIGNFENTKIHCKGRNFINSCFLVLKIVKKVTSLSPNHNNKGMIFIN